jgi:hypothetical protein
MAANRTARPDARARGEHSAAFAEYGFGNSSRAFGSNSTAYAHDGNGNIARALGNGAEAEAGGNFPAGQGSFNREIRLDFNPNVDHVAAAHAKYAH